MELANDLTVPSALVVKRGRLGNFQFSFATDRGRLNGNVTVAIVPGQSSAETEEIARHKISELIQAFAIATKRHPLS